MASARRKKPGVPVPPRRRQEELTPESPADAEPGIRERAVPSGGEAGPAGSPSEPVDAGGDDRRRDRAAFQARRPAGRFTESALKHPPEDAAGPEDARASTGSAGPPAERPAWREAILTKLRLLPRQSGVYLFRDSRGRVIYVGKAKRLHMRVRSYFRSPAPVEPRLRLLRRRIRSVDWVVTGHEVEALVLEDSLIKQYAPRYNIRLKDDKRYPYIKVTVGHPFPAMFVTRTVTADGSRYYGPFTRVTDLRQTLKTLRSVFQLRNCTDLRLARGGRECLQYFINRCTAPCTLRVDAPAYAEQVQPLLDFLSGKGEEVVLRLRQRMLDAAGSLRFEESARLRDNIATLEELMRDRAVVAITEGDSDVIGIAVRGGLACGVFLHLRDGRILGKSHRVLTGVLGAEPGELARYLLLAVYLNAAHVPRRIVMGVKPRDRDSIRSALSAAAGYPVEILSDPDRETAHLLEVAAQNAHLTLEEEELKDAQKQHRVDHSIYALQEALGLPHPPYRIEGYDISNIQGSHPVASQVVFKDGKALKSDYRRFRIVSTPGPDDFAMMEEVLRRRLERLRTRGGAEPGLILVDGGKGQVSRALAVMERMGFAHLPLVGLAKREEEIVLPGRDQPLRLPRTSEALKLLQRVRDEAHRFAIRYHRGLRSRSQRASRLDQIAGIGPARRRMLLRKFGSLEGMRQAGPEALASTPGIGPSLARALWEAIGGESQKS